MAKKKKEVLEPQEEPQEKPQEELQEEPIVLGEVDTAPPIPSGPPPSAVKALPGKKLKVPKGEKP